MQNKREYLALLALMKQTREHTGMTQEDLARSMNISRSQYTALESGRSMLSVDHLMSIAKAYGMSTWRFLQGTV